MNLSQQLKQYFENNEQIALLKWNLKYGHKAPVLNSGLNFHNPAFLASLGAQIERFASMNESFNSLDNVLGQHFVEWFSGKQISSIWNFTDIAGTGSSAMEDVIDEGYQITTGTTDDNESSINFNNKRQYDNTNAVIIAVSKRDATARMRVGFSENTDMSNSFALVDNDSDQTNYRLSTDDGTTESSTDSSSPIAVDTSYHVHKVELNASDCDLYIDGVLEVNGKTTNLPDAKQQPFFAIKARSTGAKTGNIRFLEAFNKTVSVNSSLYERLSPLTQVMNQRVVETFSGSDIDTDRWQKSDVAGTNTFAMADEIDDGFKITTGSSSTDNGAIDFNSINQYDETNSVAILIAKFTNSGSYIVRTGLSETNNVISSNNFACAQMNTGLTNFSLVTKDGSTLSVEESSVPHDTNFHVFKVELKASSADMYIDGVLEVNGKTTNLPTVSLQPIFSVRTNEAVAHDGQIRYYEAYNKLTTETDYPSVYELFNPLTTISKQHLWEWFSGDSWTNRWTKTDIAGTGSLTIQDILDGGGLVTSGGTTNNETQANFNNKRQFSNSAAELIAIMKATSVTSSVSYCGFSGNQGTFDGTEKSIAVVDSTNTNIALGTADGSTYTETEGSVAIDTNFHSYKIDNKASSIDLYVDGVIDVNGKATNLPTAKMQPVVGVKTLTGSAKTTECRFIEAYNT